MTSHPFGFDVTAIRPILRNRFGPSRQRTTTGWQQALQDIRQGLQDYNRRQRLLQYQGQRRRRGGKKKRSYKSKYNRTITFRDAKMWYN